MRKKLFSDITMAPRDGSLIEVRHGPQQEIVLARWNGQTQAFVRDDDQDRKTIHRVTAPLSKSPMPSSLPLAPTGSFG